jgi:hypothetical protein
MSATSELRAMRQQLKELDLAVPAALGPEEQQRVFLELRGELRAERDFKALLEATPGITVGTSWPLVKRKVCPEPPISWVVSCFTPQRGGCFVDCTQNGEHWTSIHQRCVLHSMTSCLQWI